MGYPFPPQAHQPLQTPRQQPQPFPQQLGVPLPMGMGMGQMPPPPSIGGASDPAAQRQLAPPPNANAAAIKSEPGGPPPISGPMQIAGPTNASTAATPQNATPRPSKRTPGSPSKEQRKRGEAETLAGNEAGPERATAKRKASTQQVVDNDAPAPSSKRRKARK